MREAAERYREFKKEGRKGGTEVAARRATQILSGNELSPNVVVEMEAGQGDEEIAVFTELVLNSSFHDKSATE